MTSLKSVVLSLLITLCSFVSVYPESTGDLNSSFESEHAWGRIIQKITDQKVDSLAVPMSGKVLKHVDFRMEIDTGTLFLFEPIVLNGQAHYYGGYFVGKAQLHFKPRIQTERIQVQRFFDADSVSRKVNHATILFSESVLEGLSDGALVTSSGPLKKDLKVFKDGELALMYHSEYYTAVQILKTILHPQPEPSLSIQVIEGKLNQVLYQFNPFSREEIGLGMVHPESRGPELVCSYSQYVDETMVNVNGKRKDVLIPLTYKINSSIDQKGILRSEATVACNVLDESAQFATMYLHRVLKVDAVETVDGTPVPFLREKEESPGAALLMLALDEPPQVGKPLVLKFRYHGDIARRDLGLFFVDASTLWYPRIIADFYSQFELNFSTPSEFTLIASASLVDSSTVGDTLYTKWRTTRPEKGVTFNIAEFEKRSYEEDGLPSVELYLNRPLHEALRRQYRKDWHKNVSESILGSLKFFSTIYGSPLREKFRATEMLGGGGESFPGFINLSWGSFKNKNVWGEDIILRAHEVAHQWFGSTVGYETYHDQWLSEGLATYSSLRYCHTVVKHEQFYEKLREFRDKVYSVRKDWFHSGEEAGAIIQGYRTTSSKTSGDFKLVIYEKAALVMHMLRCHLIDWNTLDDSKFNDFLKAFYEKHAGRNATTQDFKNLLEERTGIDWTFFFNQWIYGNELPEYKFQKEIREDSDGIWRANCRIEQKNVSPDFTVIMPVEIEFDKDRRVYSAVLVRGDTNEFTLAFEEKPMKIRLNPFEAVLAKVKQ